MMQSMGPLDTDSERTRILNRLRRLEGQVRGLQTMIESKKDCDEVLTQIMAAQSAFKQIGLHIVVHSMRRCLEENRDLSRDEMIDDAIAIFLKYSACTR